MKRASSAAICLLLICAASVSVLSQEKRRRLPYRFLIPEGYVGWVRVDFGIAGAPALPAEGDYYILKIPLNGRLQTSSRRMIVRGEKYYYFSDDAQYQLEINSQSDLRMIQDNFSGPRPGTLDEPFPGKFHSPSPYFYFFVGPTAEYNKCKFNEPCNEQDGDGYPKTGPRVFLTQEELERLNVRHP